MMRGWKVVWVEGREACSIHQDESGAKAWLRDPIISNFWIEDGISNCLLYA